MSEYRSKLMRVLSERGYIKTCTNAAGLDELAASGMIVGYVGFDCTAPSLHVGNLVSIMMLRILQRTGNRPIVLIGGGTSKVGDPSGKDESRKLLSNSQIAANSAGIRKSFDRFLRFGKETTDAILVDNATWLDRLRYIPFLRRYGKCFSVNRMLTFESVKRRLERQEPLSFLEFNYMILQAYDFLELNRLYDCRLQMGGSDQEGNIINGIELGRRIEGKELFGITTELLTTSSGAKMGKTASGAVWLNANLLSPYDYWQYWRNVEDADVGRFLRLFTELPLGRIRQLEDQTGDRLNKAKEILAREATKLAHGAEAARKAAQTASTVFKRRGISAALPVHYVSEKQLEDGIGILNLVVEAGLANSTSEVRRAIANNAISFNDQRVTEIGLKLDRSHFPGRGAKLSFGKKQHVIIKPKKEYQASYHIVPHHGGWIIKRDEVIAHSRTFSTQKDALAHAKRLASRGSFDLFVHSKDGRVQKSSKIGTDRSRH
jgi:tyrosyl-tRNA synthetase